MALRVKVSMTVPKKLLKNIHFQTAIAQAQRKYTEPDLMKLFGQTIDGWENRPAFGSKQVVNSSQISMSVYPKGVFGGANKAYKVYNLVNFGAPPHKITPRKRSGFLQFQTGYKAATIPGELFSHRPSRFGKHLRAKMLNHPGFEARSFDMLIAEEYKSTFYADMDKAMRDVVGDFENYS